MFMKTELVTVNELLSQFSKLNRVKDKDEIKEIVTEVLESYYEYCKERLSLIENKEDTERYVKEFKETLQFQNNVWMNTILILSKDKDLTDYIPSFVNLVYSISGDVGKMCWPNAITSPDLDKIIEGNKLRVLFEESLKEKLGGEKANINFKRNEKDQYINPDLNDVWLTFKRKYDLSKKTNKEST